MADFAWALQQMKLGKRVRRPSWKEGSYAAIETHHRTERSPPKQVLVRGEYNYQPSPEVILAEDWELAPASVAPRPDVVVEEPA
jgi:hypothetical protein